MLAHLPVITLHSHCLYRKAKHVVAYPRNPLTTLVNNFQSNAKIFSPSFHPVQIVIRLPIGTKTAATVGVRTRPSPRTRTPPESQTSTIRKVPSSSSNHCRKVHYDVAAVLQLRLSVSGWPTSTIRTTTTTFCYRPGPHRKNVTLNRPMTSGAASASSVIQRASSASVRTNSTAPSVSLYLPS